MGAPDAGDRVEQHYGRGQILESVFRALRELGKDVTRLAPADLAPVDAFHVRGREATVELAELASLTPGLRLLDVGCGLGGSVRYLAAEHRVRATGVDLTREYVDAARALAEAVGLGDRVAFHQSGALDLPFEDGAFDVVWTEHVQMNIEDKRAFYAELARVLAPGGRLVFHDIFQGDGGPVQFPVPWAEDASISFLAPPDAVRALLETLGFGIRVWEDKSRRTLDWFTALLEKQARSGPPPLGLHLLMGPTARTKFANLVRNLREGRCVVVQALAEKSSRSVHELV